MTSTNHKKGGLMSTITTYLLRGVLFSIPFGLCVFVLSVVLGIAENWFGQIAVLVVQKWVPSSWLVGPLAGGHVPGVSLLLMLTVLTLIGWVASWPLGRQGLYLIDFLCMRFPFLNAIYSAARKMVEAVFDPNKPKFQRVVFVEIYAPGVWSTAFVAGEVINAEDGLKYLELFIPFPPNPTNGMSATVLEERTHASGMTTEEGFKKVMSMGLLTPHELPITGPKPAPQVPPSKSDGSSK